MDEPIGFLVLGSRRIPLRRLRLEKGKLVYEDMHGNTGAVDLSVSA